MIAASRERKSRPAFRPHRHPEDWIEWVHLVMVAWGRWAASVEDSGRGWPRSVSWATLHVSNAPFESKLPSEIDRADIEMANRAIDHLGPHPRLIVTTYYKRGASRDATADLLHCSKRLVTETVATSHPTLAQFMSRT